jgi:hypothetical protein
VEEVLPNIYGDHETEKVAMAVEQLIIILTNPLFSPKCGVM